MSDNCNHNHMHGEECDCENDTLVITLDDDTELECNVIGVFEVKGKEYIALLPVDDDTVLLYQYQEIEDNIELNAIEEDDEFDAVTEAFFELYNEDEEFEVDEE